MYCIQVNGAFTGNVPVESILSETRYLYNPFCVDGTRVKVIAEVTEEGRGLKALETLIIPLESDSVSFTFADSMPKFFRPGLAYTVKVTENKINHYKLLLLLYTIVFLHTASTHTVRY